MGKKEGGRISTNLKMKKKSQALSSSKEYKQIIFNSEKNDLKKIKSTSPSPFETTPKIRIMSWIAVKIFKSFRVRSVRSVRSYSNRVRKECEVRDCNQSVKTCEGV